MVGMGLLEAVPEEIILRIAKEQEKVGMAGKPNTVWDMENEQMVLGRLGWKANQPSIRQQTAAAFFGDIGATSYMFPEENCPAVQVACLDLPSASKCGGQGGCTGNTYRPEVVPSRLTNITLYLQALAVPARRNVDDPAFKRGEFSAVAWIGEKLVTMHPLLDRERPEVLFRAALANHLAGDDERARQQLKELSERHEQLPTHGMDRKSLEQPRDGVGRAGFPGERGDVRLATATQNLSGQGDQVRG